MEATSSRQIDSLIYIYNYNNCPNWRSNQFGTSLGGGGGDGSKQCVKASATQRKRQTRVLRSFAAADAARQCHLIRLCALSLCCCCWLLLVKANKKERKFERENSRRRRRTDNNDNNNNKVPKRRKVGFSPLLQFSACFNAALHRQHCTALH